MIYRFDGFEIDTAAREVRRRGELRPLQPQAFAVLDYLLRHRDRAVPKRELLDELWPDTVVGEGSVQRAIHLVRLALDDDGSTIRTIPRHGYRFVARVEEEESANVTGGPAFLPRFARSGDTHIAYYTLGEGDLAIVLVPGWAAPMRAFLEHPEVRAGIEALTAFGQVVLFDKRGTGLSDRVKNLPTLEQRMDDLRAVLDAVGSREAVLIGYSEGGPLCLLFATTYAERTRGLLLVGSFPRWAAGADYPHGWTPEVVARLRSYIGHSWGAGATIKAIAESRASDPSVIAWAARSEQEGASPGAALELLEMNLQIDVRPLLASVAVPTVVLHHTGDTVIHIENGRYLATHIPGARMVEVDGLDHAFLFEHSERLREQVAWLAQARREVATERFLSTVLTIEVEDVTASRNLDEVVAQFRGVSAGPGPTFCFDGPQRAIQCGHELAAALAAGGRRPRVGIHTGEVARQDRTLVGPAVDIAATVARAAPRGEVWATRVVRDLVHGSPLRFEPRGEVEIDGGHIIAVMASLAPTASVRKR